MKKVPKLNKALPPDHQIFDEVRIRTLPRYKTSELSGDEWRISAVVEFYLKGHLCFQTSYGDVRSACFQMASTYDKATWSEERIFHDTSELCDQEGCSALASVWYKRKQHYCDKGLPHPLHGSSIFRGFCQRHSTRGNGGLDDSDPNYEFVSGDVAEPQSQDKRQARLIIARPKDNEETDNGKES